MQRIVYETHMHTPLCRHAEGEPEEYAAVAERRGLAGITVTCHNPMPESYGHSGRMTEAEVETYLAMIERCGKVMAGRVEVHAGMEFDYFPGFEQYVENQVKSLPVNYAIGSVHPQLAIWRRKFTHDGTRQTQLNYFDQLAEAAETKLFDCISHPDLIKNMTGDEWNFKAIAPSVAECLDRIAATGTAMELNTSGRIKPVREMNPNPAMLKMMRERNIPVVVGGDAHVPHRVSDYFEQAYDLLQSCGYTHVSYFLKRTRHEIPIAAARASLKPDPVSAQLMEQNQGE